MCESTPKDWKKNLFPFPFFFRPTATFSFSFNSLYFSIFQSCIRRFTKLFAPYVTYNHIMVNLDQIGTRRDSHAFGIFFCLKTRWLQGIHWHIHNMNNSPLSHLWPLNKRVTKRLQKFVVCLISHLKIFKNAALVSRAISSINLSFLSKSICSSYASSWMMCRTRSWNIERTILFGFSFCNRIISQIPVLIQCEGENIHPGLGILTPPHTKRILHLLNHKEGPSTANIRKLQWFKSNSL